jgi:MYXO-CTERM domain-containing protein
MKMPRFARILASCIVLASIFGTGNEARAWTGLEGPPFPSWGTIPVKFYVNKASFPPNIAGVAEQRLLSGFASWSAPNCTYFETLLVGDLPGSTYDVNDGKNVLLWINSPNPWPEELGPEDSVIGVALPIWSNDGMGHLLLDDVDIIFNNVGYCWYDYDPANPDVTCLGGKPVDTLSIVTHEQGHFLGLGHTNVTDATMEPAYLGGNSLASLEQDDIDGVCALYPLGGAGGGASCDSCAQNSCLTPAKACTGPCIGLRDCIFDCPKNDVDAYDACATKCTMQFKDGLMAYTAYTNCLCTICADPCSMECAGPVDSCANSTGPSNDGGHGGACNAPQDTGTGCGCAVIEGDDHIGALTMLGLLWGALARQRRRR